MALLNIRDAHFLYKTSPFQIYDPTKPKAGLRRKVREYMHVLHVCTSPRHILGASNTPDCGHCVPLVWG